jgi:transcriptional regulator with XRE-family HTH domain
MNTPASRRRGARGSPARTHAGERAARATDRVRLIRAARRARRLRLEDVALAAGVGIRYLSELERGKPTARLGEALRVVKSLGLELVMEDPLEGGTLEADSTEPSPQIELRLRVARAALVLDHAYAAGEDLRVEERAHQPLVGAVTQ